MLRIFNIFSRKSIILIIFLIIIILSLVNLASLLIFVPEDKKLDQEQEELKITPIIEKRRMPRQMDGVLVAEEKANLYPIAITIENMVEARPTSGLSKANLVYEAITEGGITRFLAFYASDEEIKKIGPIRSARPYFLDWTEEFKAFYLHVGGSPEALKKISQYQIFDLNQYFNGKYFWRAKNRSAPHNVYTSSKLLSQALKDKKIPLEGNYQPWLFKDENEVKGDQPKINKITINYSTFPYQVGWEYSPLDNTYKRFQAEKPQTEADGLEIKAKNVIVQVVKTYILDEIGRRRKETLGEGKALIFQDGQVIKGKWIKKTRGARTRFYDNLDQEIKFNRGTTWIQVVSSEKMINYE